MLGRFTSSVPRPDPWATVVSDALMSVWLGDALAGEIDWPSAEELLSEVSDDAMRTLSELYDLRAGVTTSAPRGWGDGLRLSFR